MSALRVDRKWLFNRQTNAIDPQRTWKALTARSAFVCWSPKTFTMPAYMILQNTVKDEAQYQKYAQAAWLLMVRFGASLSPDAQV
jgi:hypothetical protein